MPNYEHETSAVPNILFVFGLNSRINSVFIFRQIILSRPNTNIAKDKGRLAVTYHVPTGTSISQN